MIGGPYQGAPEALSGVYMNQGIQHGQTDLTGLITILITEIRSTLNTKIDILNEKIEQKNQENEHLVQEIHNLRSKVTQQEQTIEELTKKQQSQNNDIPQTSRPVQQQQQQQRGIKAHNLVITCPQMTEDDPKTYIEDIFLNKFHRKPALNAVQVLNPRGNGNTDINTMGETIDSTSTTSDQTTNSKILVTFNSVWEARAIYRERIQALKNSGIFIAEDLSREQSGLFYRARQLRKNNVISNTWTEDGIIYIKEKDGTTPRILNENDTLLKQKREIPENTILQPPKGKENIQKTETNTTVEKLEYKRKTGGQDEKNENTELNDTSSDSSEEREITKKKTSKKARTKQQKKKSKEQ